MIDEPDFRLFEERKWPPMKKLILALLLCSLCAIPASADEPVLSIGDALPAMDISHFLQGGEVTGLDKDRVYILEFWATW